MVFLKPYPLFIGRGKMTDETLFFGRCYHLYCAGNPKEAIFRLEADYQAFLDLFRMYVNPIVNLYGYCLLPTHFHLLLRIKEKKEIEYVYGDNSMLWVQFSNLFRAYLRYVNGKYQRSGSLIHRQITREVPRDKALLSALVVYMHQNPQIFGIVSDFRIWPFSSCYAYMRQDRRSMIAKETLLDPVFQKRIVEAQVLSQRQVSDWEGDFNQIQ